MLSAASGFLPACGSFAAGAAESGQGKVTVILSGRSKDGFLAHPHERAGAPGKTPEKPLTPVGDSWASPEESWVCQSSPTLEEQENSNAAAAAAAVPAPARLSATRVAEAATAAYVSGVAPRSSTASKFVATSTLADAEAARLLDTCGDGDFHPVFVFTNPTSGGNKAAAFTKVRRS